MIFEVVCHELGQACRKERVIREIEGPLKDIWNMCLSFQCVGFTWVNCEGNHVAHTIATLASSGSLTGNWRDRLPMALREALTTDKRKIDDRV